MKTYKIRIVIFLYCIIAVAAGLHATTPVNSVSGTISLTNCVVYGNETTYDQTSSSTTVSYSAIQLNSGSTLPSGSGNVVFTDLNYKDAVAPTDTFSYYLSPKYSAFLNAGTNTVSLTSKDINGNDRLYDGTVDIGAVEYSLINTVSSSTWSTAAHWNIGRIPTSYDIVSLRLPATVTTTDALCRKLIVESTGSLTVNADKQLIVSDSIRNKVASRIVVKASTDGTTANGTLIFNNLSTNPVYATVEMYSRSSYNTSNAANKRYVWQYFGVPVVSMQPSPAFDGAYVRVNQESGTESTYWKSLTNSSTMSPFVGYEHCFQTVGNVVSITGALVNYDYSSGQLGNTSGAKYPGKNLLANPYTASIDAKNIVFGSALEQTVYLYNTGSYNVWSGTASTSSDSTAYVPGSYTAIPKAYAGTSLIPRLIPSMSSMLVQYSSAGTGANANGTVSIAYKSAVVKNKSQQRVASPEANNTPVTMIDVCSKSGTDRVWIFTDEQCTRGFDNGYDAFKNTGNALYHSISASEKDGEYQIDAIPDLNNTILAFQAGQDSVYHMKFTHSNLSDNYSEIYLIDMVRNSITDVSQSGAGYCFTASSTPSAVKRFCLVTRRASKTDEEGAADAVQVFCGMQRLFVRNLSAQAGKTAIYEASGRRLTDVPLSAYGLVSVPVASSQAYIVKVNLPQTTFTKKVVAN